MEISVFVTSHWVTIENPSSTLKNILKLQEKSVIGVEKEQPMEDLVILTSNWVTIENPSSTLRNV